MFTGTCANASLIFVQRYMVTKILLPRWSFIPLDTAAINERPVYQKKCQVLLWWLFFPLPSLLSAKHKVFQKDKSYDPKYQPRTKKNYISISMIYKAIEKCVSGTRRLRVHEANAKISITMQISSPSTKMIPQGF